jgi:uncharacterized protein with ParB-like and HNH nuclease domain
MSSSISIEKIDASLIRIGSLYRDLNDAINANAQDYFLGTMVTTRNKARLTIIDGQQRLVTVSVLSPPIRDYF